MGDWGSERGYRGDRGFWERSGDKYVVGVLRYTRTAIGVWRGDKAVTGDSVRRYIGCWDSER